MPQNQTDNDLCPAGKVLEARLNPCINNMEKACQSLQDTCTQIAESIKDLTEYAIRDKEHIAALGKSMDCKSKKLNLLDKDIQEINKNFAAHLGEHKAERRLTIASGVGGAGGILGIWELLKYLVKGQ